MVSKKANGGGKCEDWLLSPCISGLRGTGRVRSVGTKWTSTTALSGWLGYFSKEDWQFGTSHKHQNHGMISDYRKPCSNLIVSLVPVQGTMVLPWPLSHSSAHGEPESWQWDILGVGVMEGCQAFPTGWLGSKCRDGGRWCKPCSLFHLTLPAD